MRKEFPMKRTWDLSTTFIEPVPWVAAGYVIDEFDGDSDYVFVQQSQDPNRKLDRDKAHVGKSASWDEDRQLHIVNTLAQPGKKVVIRFLAPEEKAEAGMRAIRLCKPSGEVINPATNEPFENKPTLVSNQKTAPTGTAESIASSSTPVPDGFGVVVKAMKDNTDKVYVGKTGVTASTGLELNAKESITLYVTDVQTIFVLGASADQKVCWIVEQTG